MISTIPMNYKCLIFDPQVPDEDGKSDGRVTINGLPPGIMSPSYPHLVGGDGKPQPIDVKTIVDAFHPETCVYTGAPAEGINILDGNPQNFLITNLEPISKAWMDSLPFLPKAAITRVFPGATGDLEVEVYGAPLFRAEETLNNLQIPEVPGELGLAHYEAELLWVWNQLTKVTLLKGLRSLTKRNKQTGVSVALTNKDVLEFTFKLLHQDFTTQEN
ncbi:hypothetical protein LCGC14_0624680 [marine sediment metagenome]|uniref:Uncharacterized protein n=1 Tax=marine sediment metagenome TaxID=412755 RepID=A0A0F9UC73_9ZZZZ